MKTEVVVRAFAQRRPQHEALVCGGERRTYGELEQRTNRIAHALHGRGLHPGDRLALLLDNGIPWVEVALGAIKCGALVVPVSTRLTEHEVAFVAADCNPHALVCDPANEALGRRAAGASGCDVLNLGELEALAAQAARTAPAVPPPLPDDCMIVYTSGTEEAPKGVVTTHANLLLTAFVNDLEFGLRSDDRFLITTPLAHRTALARLWNAFTLGATAVLMSRFDAAETVVTIVRERVTVAGLVPTVARMLLDRVAADGSSCSSLRMMISAGEPFPVALKERLFAALPHVGLYSALGMTEAFGAAVLLAEDQLAHAAAAGRPTPGVEVRLVDDAGREVATGEVGEIVVRSGAPGQWLGTRGYWNRPEATATVMRDGWVHSGDLGRFDADGFLYVVDRKKDMVLSGGLNVSSREVEEAIARHPAVRACAVVAAPDATFGEAVVAFVETAPGAAVTADEIVAYARERLAGYKKPRYVFFEALPRNAQGKVLKRELRARLDTLLADRALG